MPTRPGYIWNGTEWVTLGQAAASSPIAYQASAPTSPSTGDLWVQSSVDVLGVDSSQFLRWRKTVSGGETSLSGADDTGLTLTYTPNYEQVYLNGVLLVRSQDYTATTGTSITGLTALAANDVVEVFGVVARTVGDVYTQSQSDSKYATTVDFPAGAWQSWSPTLSGGWANGNGTWSARYAKLGKVVFVSGSFTVGSTTTKGTGMTLSLPVNAQNINFDLNARFLDNTGNITYSGTFRGSTSTTMVARVILASGTYGSQSQITATAPWTWATGDVFYFSGSYEAA